MTPTIRKATYDDLKVLQEFKMGLIAAELPMDPTIRPDTTSYYAFKPLIDGPNSTLLVATIDEEIVASGYAKILEDRRYLKHTHYGYLGFMFVPEKHRGNGYNGVVTEALIAWCKEQGITEIRLDVYDVNEAAIKAYEKSGFKPHLINMRYDP
ncbi:GNAT family N-acetyltransferase [Gilvibacter sp.]|uniref:GNAT family N-acetyltransferase n=1 Tax=Gilvibacter sp. TaxID=2729997 RepID=UPI003F49C99C